MRQFRFGVALCALALAACGGGGDSSPPPVTGGGGGGGGTPTPTPPAVTYTAFNDLTGEQTFDTACARGANGVQEVEVFPYRVAPITFTLSGDRTTWLVQASVPSGVANTSFGPSDISTDDPGVQTVYIRQNPGSASDVFAFITPQWPSATPDYVRAAFFQVTAGSPVSYNCIFGVATQLDDTLPTTTLNYTQDISTGGTLVVFSGQNPQSYALTDSVSTISADPTTGEVSFVIELIGRAFSFDANGNRIDSPDVTNFGTYTGTAQVTGNEQNFVGELVKSGGSIGLANQFTGWFFGPQGEEIGVVFSGREQLVDGSNVSFSFGITAQVDP